MINHSSFDVPSMYYKMYWPCWISAQVLYFNLCSMYLIIILIDFSLVTPLNKFCLSIVLLPSESGSIC